MADFLLKYRVSLISVVLGIVTFAVYLPVRNHEFVLYDDDVYITENPDITSGLTRQSVERAFTRPLVAMWNPLTTLSHILDCQLFGLNPAGHHLVSALIHTANAILFFLLLVKMTGKIWPSAFVAAVFALHPLNVESVAWASERKNVLSGLFMLFTIAAYIFYTKRPRFGRYMLLLLTYGLCIMTKPSVVTLPFVLLLLDFWPLERFQNYKSSILNSVLEKIPLFVLSAICSIVTYFVARQFGGTAAPGTFTLGMRLTNAVCAYVTYITKMVWPTRLAVLYPHPAEGIPAGIIWRSAIALVFITVLVLKYFRSYKYLLVGWLWFLGTLVPVIGIVQAGVQAMADRYAYFPLIGLFIIVAFGAIDLYKDRPLAKYVLSASAIAIVSACAVATSIQLKYWKDSSSLFEHTLSVNKYNPRILNNYATVLSSQGKHEQARQCLVEALELSPDSPGLHNNLGKVLQDLGKPYEAMEQYRFALKLDPNYTMAQYNLGAVLESKGQIGQAVECYKKALQIDPDYQAASDKLNALGYK